MITEMGSMVALAGYKFDKRISPSDPAGYGVIQAQWLNCTSVSLEGISFSLD